MAETMEQYISKTRTDYGSVVARLKIEDKDHFKLKGQFLKELQENTFSGSDHEDVNEHIEKVLEIVDLFHVPNVTVDQLMLRVFPISLTGTASRWLRNEPTGSIKTWEDLKTKFLNKYCLPGRTTKKMEEINNFQQEPDETLYQAWERFKELLMKCPQHYLTEMQEGPYYTKDCPLKEEGKTLKEAYYTQFGTPFQGGGYRAATPGFYQRNNDNPSFQEQRQSMEETERGFGSLLSSTEPNLRDHVKSISTTIEADTYLIRRASVSVMRLSTYINLELGELAHTKLIVELADRIVKYPKGIAENVLVGIGKLTFPVDFIILDMPEDIKVPLILGRPFLVTARDKIDVYKRKITLRKGWSLMGETLVINRSLDPLIGDYIELDFNVPFELRRDQVDDLMPTIEEDFAVLEDMDAYRDEGMGDVIFGEPFLREVGINAKRFDGMITICNGNDEVSEEDEKNGISHAYQKLKGFYKGVLNLGPEYI
ncbi:putative reverse transcriptase domain-containing protein [Tanacetum coccineum]